MELAPLDHPEHAGLFEARTDDGFAVGFDDAGSREEVLLAELGITHAFGVGCKVGGFGARCLRRSLRVQLARYRCSGGYSTSLYSFAASVTSSRAAVLPYGVRSTSYPPCSYSASVGI